MEDVKEFDERKRIIEEEDGNARKKLLNRMRGINGWISENPHITEPNMYEMIGCITELGIFARKDGVAQKPNKFPESGSGLAELYAEWNKMYRARLAWDKVQSTNFSVNKKTNLYAYFTDLNMRCCIGEFRFPGMTVIEEELTVEERAELLKQRNEFLECVKKIGSVSLYINQQRLQNPNFVYYNQEEYQWLIDTAKKYEEYLPAYSSRVLADISATRVLMSPDNPGEDGAPGL